MCTASEIQQCLLFYKLANWKEISLKKQKILSKKATAIEIDFLLTFLGVSPYLYSKQFVFGLQNWPLGLVQK